MKPKLWKSVPVVFSSLMLTSGVPAQQLAEIYAQKDVTIYSEGDLSNAQGLYNYVGNNGFDPDLQQQKIRRALVSFNVLQVVPVGAQIVDVELEMVLDRLPGDGSVDNQDISLHRLTTGWYFGTSIENTPGGDGKPATPLDPTWIHSQYPDVTWSTPGGDYHFFPSATLTVPKVKGNYTWKGSLMVDDVQSWVNGTAPDNGWIMIGVEDAYSMYFFSSVEASNPFNSPLLRVWYTEAGSSWAGFSFVGDAQDVDTGDWLGMINVSNAPWVYAYQLDSYIYLPEEFVSESGGWGFVPIP